MSTPTDIPLVAEATYIHKCLDRIVTLHARADQAFKEKGTLTNATERDQLAGLLAIKALRAGAPLDLVNEALTDYISQVYRRPWAFNAPVRFG